MKTPSFDLRSVAVIVSVSLASGGIYLWQRSLNLSLKKELEQKISYYEERLSQSEKRASELEIQNLKIQIEQGKYSLVSKTGKIAILGNEPFTYVGLRVEGEQTYCLVGPLENELISHYQGAVATVEGIVVEGFCPNGQTNGKTIKVISVE